MKLWVVAVLSLAATVAEAQPAPHPPCIPPEVVSDTLHALGEAPLGKLVARGQAVRFLWLRSFGKPILVRLDEQDRQWILSVKVLDAAWGIGANGVQIGKLTYQRRWVITEGEWSSLASLMRSGFWSQESTAGSCGVDGAEWIMEGVRQGEYHLTARWSPADGTFRAVCLAMLRLSRLRLRQDEIY